MCKWKAKVLKYTYTDKALAHTNEKASRFVLRGVCVCVSADRRYTELTQNCSSQLSGLNGNAKMGEYFQHCNYVIVQIVIHCSRTEYTDCFLRLADPKVIVQDTFKKSNRNSLSKYIIFLLIYTNTCAFSIISIA